MLKDSEQTIRAAEQANGATYDRSVVRKAIQERAAYVLVQQAQSLYAASDSRGDMAQVWQALGKAWEIRAGVDLLTDVSYLEREPFSSQPELLQHGREWVYMPPHIQVHPELLSNFFPGLDAVDFSIVKNRRLREGFNWYVLTNGNGADSPGRENATLPFYIIAHNARMDLTGKPIDQTGQSISLLSGSRINDQPVYVSFDRDADRLRLYTHEEAMQSGLPIIARSMHDDDRPFRQ